MHCILVSCRVDVEDYPIDQPLPKDGQMHVLGMEILGEIPAMIMAFRGQPNAGDFTAIDALRQWCEGGHPKAANMAQQFETDAGRGEHYVNEKGEELFTFPDALPEMPIEELTAPGMPKGAKFDKTKVYYFFYAPSEKYAKRLLERLEIVGCKHQDRYPDKPSYIKVGHNRWNIMVYEKDGPGHLARKPLFEKIARVMHCEYDGWEVEGTFPPQERPR